MHLALALCSPFYHSMKTKQLQPALRPDPRPLFNPFLPFTPTMSGNLTSFFTLDAPGGSARNAPKRGRKKTSDLATPY